MTKGKDYIETIVFNGEYENDGLSKREHFASLGDARDLLITATNG